MVVVDTCLSALSVSAAGRGVGVTPVTAGRRDFSGPKVHGPN